MKRNIRNTLLALLLVTTAGAAPAKNIDLVTLPDRDGVQLTIYNSEDITLVREVREITLKKGINRLQFSWHGTLIDPTSVEFNALTHKDKVEISHTTLPGQKPTHLVWHIKSAIDGQIKAEVTYFTSGLTWTMDYVAVTDPQENRMRFDGFVRVYNNSGEEYSRASVRLIVGKINLVEKIADLARREGITGQMSPAMMSRFRRDALRSSFSKAEDRRSGGSDDEPDTGKQIVKEGLSEYFMFVIPGYENLQNGWSKRLNAVSAEDIPFRTVYRLRTHQYGADPVRFFIWQNDDKHKLGTSPLPDGQVQIFRRSEGEGLSYLGQQNLLYVPIRAKIEVNLGVDPRVIFRLRQVRTMRSDFRFYKPQYGNDETVEGWNEECQWQGELRNYRDKDISFEWQQQWAGDVTLSGGKNPVLFDYRTVEMTTALPGRNKTMLEFRTLLRHGKNKRQERVTLG